MADKKKEGPEREGVRRSAGRRPGESKRARVDYQLVGRTLHAPGMDEFRAVFDGSNDAIFIHDGESARILAVNAKTCEMFGYSTEEVLDKDMAANAGFPPYTRVDAVSWIRKAVAEGPQVLEWLVRHRTGKLFWIEVNLKPAVIGGKNLVLAIVRDITERKRVEQELRATKDYLRTVFNNVYDAIFIHDLDGKVMDVNDKLLDMYGISREEAINRYIVPDYSGAGNAVEKLPSIWEKAVSGENQFFQWRARRPRDGSEFDVEVYLTRLSLPNGDFIMANVHDITARTRTEHELRATKDYLRIVFNNVYDAIFIHDLNGKVMDVNDKMLDLYGISRREAVELSIIPDYSTPDYMADKELSRWALANWKKAIQGENQFFEWKARRPKDGSEFDVEVFLTKLTLPNGDFILANVRDISERKAMEKLLVKEREIFFSVMESNPHGIALFDNFGRFVYFNPEFTNITGYTLDDIPTGHDWVQKAYPDLLYREKVKQFWKADKRPEGRGRDVELRIVCKGGQQKDVEFRVTYLGDKSLVVLTDTTARKRAEEELRAEKLKFQTLSESSPMGMVMIDGEDNTKYVNPKFTEMFGYDANDIPTIEEWFTLAYPDPFYRRQALSRWSKDLKSVKPGEGHPYTRDVTCRDGTLKHINYIPVRLETGELLITCEDITKSKEAEDKIKERNLELSVLNEIIASVSSSLHLPEVLMTLRRVFTEQLEIPTGGIFFYDEAGSRLTMEMSWGVDRRWLGDFEAFVLNTYGLGDDHREAVIIRDHTACLRSDGFLLSKFLHKWDTSLSIPLIAKGEIQGLIFLLHSASDRFGDHQLTFYRTLGQQVGVAVQNARLFNQVRQSHAQMKALSLKLVEVQEAERRYIARELHDEIGQVLTGLKLSLEMNVLQAEEKAREGLMNSKSVVNTLMVLVRELSLNLRPSMLDDLGLLATLPWHFERFGNQANIRVAFKHAGLSGKRLPRTMETALFRIVQEALTNVARHAKVKEVVVRLWSDERTVGVQIEDDGVGFDADAVLGAGNSSGLPGMRERVALLGGHFSIETRPGAGCRITAELPLDLETEQ